MIVLEVWKEKQPEETAACGAPGRHMHFSYTTKCMLCNTGGSNVTNVTLILAQIHLPRNFLC